MDYSGCRTIADHILRTRRARMEHQRIQKGTLNEQQNSRATIGTPRNQA